MGGYLMAKLRLKYVNQYRDCRGKVRCYFRRGNVRGPLPGLAGSAEFMRAYEGYLSGGVAVETPKTAMTAEGSFGRLVTAYYGSREFRDDLRASSKTIYKRVLEPLVAAHGHRTAQLDHKAAAKLIADIGEHKPSMANLTKSVLQTVYKFAVRQELVPDNPFLGIRPFKEGTYHTWSEGELQIFETRWPVGTRQRLAYALLLYTGQRVGDVAKMRRSDIANGELHVIQMKTGVELYLPIVPELEQAMRAYPANGLALIGDANGKPMTRSGLSQFMRKAIAAAGLPGKCKSHGLRKAAMRRLAEAGMSEKQIAAVSGHKTLREIERYTAAADQRRLARDALTKPRTKLTNTPTG
jgi:integrase